MNSKTQGFLAGKEVKQNGDLNAGLREWRFLASPRTRLKLLVVDQSAALEWIQKNVSQLMKSSESSVHLSFSDPSFRW